MRKGNFELVTQFYSLLDVKEGSHIDKGSCL